jgi:uncharacterized protein YegP (UPF0339 family)
MHFEIYIDLFHLYRWRLVNEHRAEIAVSPVGYHNKLACQRYVEIIRADAAAAELLDCTRESGVQDR